MINLDPAGTQTFPETIQATDPATGESFGPAFPVASSADIDRAFSAASGVDSSFRADSGLRAAFLEGIAQRLEETKGDLIACASKETALPAGRLAGELVRTQSQLRMFAELVREGSWVDACIDSGDPRREPPKPDLRRMLVPLGPVVVFGASNFPFAFSVPGGDTASALAAGCPVIAKAHPAHPGTSDLAATVIHDAAARHGTPQGVFALVHGGVEVGRELVTHDAAEAVAFTGSLTAGRSLFDLAAKRMRPIPVFAEMGSTNPVFLLPGALEESFDALVEGYVGSLTAGVGQFCTNPGLLFGTGPRFEGFLNAVATRLAQVQAGTMLTIRIRDAYQQGCKKRACVQGLRIHGPASASEAQVAPCLFTTDLKTFLDNPVLLEELFGPTAVAVECPSTQAMLEIVSRLPGQLTATVHALPGELESSRDLIAALTRKVGRIVYNGFPTGVEVGHAIHHGGPYPASTDSRFTSVGTAAIRRFARPVCYQGMPQDLLPLELRDNNPRGIWRTVDGKRIPPGTLSRTGEGSRIG